MTGNFFRIANLKKKYHSYSDNTLNALDDVSISLNQGDFLSIVGSNGSGKTTLLNTIAGSTKPSGGTITLDGTALSSLDETARAGFIARVRQNPNDGVINSMTVSENLTLAVLRNKKANLHIGVSNPRRKEFAAILQSLNMDLEAKLNDPVSSLSGGQKQALALVMAILAKPKLLLLDEHTAALDPSATKKILKITSDLIKENKVTALMVTHNLNQALSHGNHLVVLDRGKITYEASDKEKQNLSSDELLRKIHPQDISL